MKRFFVDKLRIIVPELQIISRIHIPNRSVVLNAGLFIKFSGNSNIVPFRVQT